jgi:hypothetical protein
MELITNYDIQPSFARTREPNRQPVRIALVQQRYRASPWPRQRERTWSVSPN